MAPAATTRATAPMGRTRHTRRHAGTWKRVCRPAGNRSSNHTHTRPPTPTAALGGPTMPHQFAIEIEPDDQGQWHFVVVNACTDEVIRVGLSHDTREGAESDATSFVYRLITTLQSA